MNSAQRRKNRFRVFIEEAAPENRELHDFVRDYLVARGHLGVEIQTEW